MKASSVFKQEDIAAVTEAIRRAEEECSVEIRVHIEDHCPENVLDRAVTVFEELGMKKTAGRNGVLIYTAVKDHVSAIIGDERANECVHREFWWEVHEAMKGCFARGLYAEGICAGIGRLREELEIHFPPDPEKGNELPDDISFG